MIQVVKDEDSFLFKNSNASVAFGKIVSADGVCCGEHTLGITIDNGIVLLHDCGAPNAYNPCG